MLIDTPMTAEKIAELKRLHREAKLGPMVSVHIISPGYEHCANLCTRLEGHKSDYPVAMMQAEWADLIAALHNAFPALIAALEEAEAECDAEAGHWIDIIRRLDQKNLCDVFDGLGVEENLRQWLAARDARLKNEGAAEWLESHRNDDWLAVDHRERFDREAAELRRKGTSDGAI